MFFNFINWIKKDWFGMKIIEEENVLVLEIIKNL